MDISQIKTIAIRALKELKIVILEYVFTKKVLWLALASLPFSTYLVITAQPNFYVSATILPVDTEPQTSTKVESLAAVFTSARKDGAQKNAKWISSLRSSDTAIEMWDRWALRLYNSDPDNIDVNKIPQRHTFTRKFASWIGGYSLPKYRTSYDLQQYIKNAVETKIDFDAYELQVWMYSTNVELTKEFLNDVILSADRNAKRMAMERSRAIIAALKRDLTEAKNSSIMTVFSEKINNEYYNIASLNNELPYFITYLDTPRANPYPVSPNILAIYLSNLIIFIFIGVGINFWQKNKDEIW
jgi:hypothetical protein